MLIDQLEDPENEHSIDYGKLLGPELRFYTAKKVRSFSPPCAGGWVARLITHGAACAGHESPI